MDTTTATIASFELLAPISENARLVTATVTAYNQDAALLRYQEDGADKTGVMPVTEFIPGRHWEVGLRVTALVIDDTSQPATLSMTRHELVPALLAGVSPEVRTGSVVVKGVARRAGVRTKLAVASTTEGVDPIAACVGRQHNRVDYIKSALLGEQVDIIAWHPDREIFLRNALQPAEAGVITIDTDAHTAVATAPSHQMSAAVGVGGTNSSLAGQLVGLQVRIESA